MAIAPRKLKFHPIGAAAAPASRTLTIRNRGKTTLGGTVNSAIDAPFSISAGAGSFSIAPRGSRKVTVVFAPAHSGKFTAAIEVTSSDPKHPTETVAVAGKGLPGALRARKSLKFPKTAAASTSTASIVIRNHGKGMLTGSVGAISGSSAFVVQSGAGAFALAHGATHTVTIAFMPPAAGKLAATLAIQSDDPKHPAVTVKLSGTGK
jgi:hypothetical protein